MHERSNRSVRSTDGALGQESTLRPAPATADETPVGRRPHLMGRLRGPRLGPAAPARARARRDGRARAAARPSSARWATCRRRAARCARCSTATGCGWSAASCRSSLHEADADDARARGRPRRARSSRPAGAEVFVAAAVVDAALVAAPSTLDDGGWERLVRHLAEIAEIVAAHGLSLALHPHVGTLVETDADVERGARAHRRRRWCFDTGHLLIGGVDPVAFVRDHARPHRPRPPQGRRRVAGGARARAASSRWSRPRRPGCSGRSGRETRGIDEVVRLLDRTGTSAGSCSSRTPPSPGRSPRSEAARSSMSGRASSILDNLALEEEGPHPMKRFAAHCTHRCCWRSRAVVVAACGGVRQQQDQHGSSTSSTAQRHT